MSRSTWETAGDFARTARRTMLDGYSEADADRRAGVRIFDEPPGIFNLNTSGIVTASGTWDSDQGMADEYLSKMGHGYGNGFWGEPMEDVFRLALSGTELVVHSSSTMLYGALDNDDFYMYMGGLAAAVRSIDGESPELLVTNTRDPGNPEMTSIDKFLGAEFRSRYVNPTWIEGMQREGYAGAGEMRAFVEYLWGWDATVPDTVDDAMWQESFEVYVEDKHDLDLQAFFHANSPFAYQDMTARMVETIRKGYWEASEETTRRLLSEYVESVATYGVGCAEHTCGNPRLLQYVLDQGAVMNIPGPLLDTFRTAMEETIGIDIATAAAAAEDFVRRNEARPATLTRNLEGFRMDTTTIDDAVPVPAPRSAGEASDGAWDALWVGVPLLGFLVAWRIRRRRA
ncbi:MAG: cobaltochelatase subunit CobN [Acidobacteria bacterium]|nr:cobaltochelatase subunit CobN [Acidobacteriota bacterium]